MSFEINKVYTDNPYVDEMVYYTKLLGLGTVLKLKDLADNNETVESLKAGGLYISCIEGTAIFEEFTSVSRTALASVGIINDAAVDFYMSNMSQIPLEYRPKLTKALREEYVANYEELNPYYRMLHGLPKIGHEDYIEDWLPPEDIFIDISKPIHIMDNSEITILEQYGVLDRMIEDDPDNRQYMRYLGKKKIDYYLARRANRFDILYIPTIDSDAIYQMYKDKLDENKFYVLRTVYSDAFKYNSDYYDNFIAIFIVLITMVDIISRVQEFITRKEIFDIRSVQYIFKSYGVPFFEEIPLKYQIAMVKNLHTLLKYKSTSKCMVDICSLFGFENIKIFKYYLLKDRKIDITTGDYVYSDDPTEEYELKFLKLPLDEDLDNYIRSTSNYIDYDEITDSDPKWDGGLDHDLVLREILKEEFNFTRTKYISIDTIYDIAKMSAQQSYFFNFLYDNIDLESMLTVQIPYISTGKSFVVADVFTLLTILTYTYNGIKDTIMDTQSKVLYVNGFNFKADLATLAADIADKKIYQFDDYDQWASNAVENDSITYPGSTLHAQEQLAKFRIPTSSIPSFNEMMDIFVNNMDVRDELLKGMQEADNKDVYDVYKKLYDALMTVELTMDYYKNPETGDFYRDSEGDATYSEYLQHKDPTLYSVILQVQDFEDQTSRNQYIANLIDSIIYALEEYIDTTEFQSLFANLPIMSSESVKQYIATVINFYKSYKVDFLGINTIYTLDDTNDGIIHLIDKIDLYRYFERAEFLSLKEKISKYLVLRDDKEILNLIEKIYFDIYTWIYIHLSENEADILVDRIFGIMVQMSHKSIIEFTEAIYEINVKNMFPDSIYFYSEMSINTKYNHKDNLGLIDKLWFIAEGESYDPYMNKVAESDVGRIIVAAKDGDSETSVRIATDSITDDILAYDAVTEKAVENYVTQVALTLDKVVKADDISDDTSDDKVLSEKAIVKLLSLNTLEDE